MGFPSSSTWNGWDDGHRSDGDASPSPPRSPFTAAFSTPRLAGILTNGVREVPGGVGEHPEDLYNALEAQFRREVQDNPEKKYNELLGRSGHLIRHLTMSEDTWKRLPKADKNATA